MSQPASALSFATWSAPETPLVVECALEVMEEMRAAACENQQLFPRGGLEVGGVLFGTAAENRVRIMAWRPIACEHAQGPSFVLSQKDRAELTLLLQNAAKDPNLRGLREVGWCVSHTRSEVCLSPADQDVYSTFFSESRQVTLVLRPEKLAGCRAGFFVRDAAGGVRSDSSYREFSLEPLDRQNAPPGPNRAPAPSAPQVISVPKPEPAPAPPPPAAVRILPPLPPRSQSNAASNSTRSKWIWMLLICAALIAGGIAVYYGKFWLPLDRSFSLRLADYNGQLRFEWAKDSPPIRAARGSSIEVTDGGSTHRFPLTSEQLQEGTFTYKRQSGDISARMTVLLDDGSSVEETAKYAGPPPVPEGPSKEVLELQAERDQLKAEVQRLRDQSQKKKSRQRRRY